MRERNSQQAKQVLLLGLYGLISITVVVLLWAVRQLIILLFVAFIISSLLRLFAHRLSVWVRDKTGLVLSLRAWYMLVFFLFYGLFLGVFVQIGFIFVNELGSLLGEIQRGGIQNLFGKLDNPQVNVLISNAINGLVQRLSIEQTLGWAGIVVNSIPYVIFLVLASWYLLFDRNNIINNLLVWLKKEDLKKRIFRIVSSLEEGMGEWAKAQFMLMLIIGVLTYIGLTLLGIRYALVLAVISGLLEALPTFGPILSSIPAIFVALLEGGIVKAILVVIFYFILQQTENAFIVPKVMNTVIGMHPFLAIIAIMVGQALFGAAGGLLAIPVYVFVTTLLEVLSNTLVSNQDHPTTK